MPDRTGRAALGTAVALAALLAAGGCGGNSASPGEAATSVDAEPVGAATLFPGSEQEEGQDIDIPQTAVGEPAARDVEIRNKSDEPMVVNDVSATGFEVSDDTCTGETINPGESCTFQLLAPPGESTTGSLTVETDQGSISSDLSAEAVEEDSSSSPQKTPPPTPTPTDLPSSADETEIIPTQTPDEPDNTPDGSDDGSEEDVVPEESPGVP